MLGHGEHTQKLTASNEMKHQMQEANSFSNINWACAVTLNPFVGFGKYVFGWQLYTNISEKKKHLIYQ